VGRKKPSGKARWNCWKAFPKTFWQIDGEKLVFLLNFDDQKRQFQARGAGIIFDLIGGSQFDSDTVHLGGYGALILKQ
jgi:hypothetical protein